MENGTYTKTEVKRAISKWFGFTASKITMLEMDCNAPGKYCMFEVAGVTYQVQNHLISIFSS